MKRKILLIPLALLLAMSLVAMGCPAPAPTPTPAVTPAPVIKLICSINHKDGTPVGLTTKFWAEELEARTDGRVKVHIFYAAVLMSHTEALEGTRIGTVDVAYISDSYYSSELPLSSLIKGLLSIWSLGISDVLAMAVRTPEDFVRELLEEEYARSGVITVFRGPGVSYNLFSPKPLSSVADLKGVKIRALDAFYYELFTQAEAVPVNVPSAEQYEALQRGTIDAVPYNYNGVIARKVHEVTSYAWPIYLTFGGVGPTIMNLDTWNAMPADIQQISKDLWPEVKAYGVQVLKKLSTEAKAELEAAGITFAAPITMEAADEWVFRTEEWYVKEAAKRGVSELFEPVLKRAKEDRAKAK